MQPILPSSTMPSLLPLLIALAASCSCAVSQQVVLTQSESVIRRPGEAHKLTCAVTDFDVSNYWMNWVWQKPGKGLEWLVAYYSTSRNYYSPAIRGRLTASKDRSNFYLQMNSLNAEDTAAYYCARGPVPQWLDYWGQGTMVTVSSASPTAPSVFPLSPCQEDLSTASEVTLGCLMLGYFPESVTVQWNAGGAIISGSQNFPPVKDSNSMCTSSNLLTIPAAKWRDGKFQCTVRHAPTNTDVTKDIPPCEKNEPVPPEVRLLHSSCKSRTSDATIELLCFISSFYPKEVTVEWLVDGQAGLLTGDTDTPRKDATGYTFSTTSTVNISQADWLEGNSYACQVTHPGSQTKVKSQAKKCKDDSGCVPTDIRMYLLPPTPKDLFLNRDPKLYCHIVNLESDEGMEVNWSREKKDFMTAEPLSVTEQPNGTYRALSVAPISIEDWNGGERFTCTLKQEGLAAPLSRSIFKKTVESRPPRVFLYPPHHEEITLRSTITALTITCMVKDFSPADISIQWLKDHNALPEDSYVNTPVMKEKDNASYFIYSKLDITASDWNSGHSYTCMVVHEGLPMKFTQRTVEKSQGKK